MSWVLLFLAGILEVVWASGLKYATTPLQWTGVIFLIAVSFIMLIIAYKDIPVAIAYAVFVGIGTVGTYIVGVLLGEPFSLLQVIGLTSLLAGVIGLKVFTNEKEGKYEEVNR